MQSSKRVEKLKNVDVMFLIEQTNVMMVILKNHENRLHALKTWKYVDIVQGIDRRYQTFREN